MSLLTRPEDVTQWGVAATLILPSPVFSPIVCVVFFLFIFVICASLLPVSHVSVFWGASESLCGERPGLGLRGLRSPGVLISDAGSSLCRRSGPARWPQLLQDGGRLLRPWRRHRGGQAGGGPEDQGDSRAEETPSAGHPGHHQALQPRPECVVPHQEGQRRVGGGGGLPCPAQPAQNTLQRRWEPNLMSLNDPNG